jgi:hypothetical protein
MPIPPDVRIREYTRVMANGAKWRRLDEFPFHQDLADQLERLLRFADEVGSFEPLLSRLRGNPRERSAVLGELWTAFYLHRRGFTVLGRDPLGVGSRVGDWSLAFKGTASIFVEVKAPDWEAELSDEERLQQGRKELGKYLHLESRAVAPFEVLMDVIKRNASPKLPPDVPNLIVTADDLFVSIVGMPHLDNRFDQCFRQPEFSRIGAVLFLPAEGTLDPDRVLIRFEENPYVDASNALPREAAVQLKAQAAIDVARRRMRFG